MPKIKRVLFWNGGIENEIYPGGKYRYIRWNISSVKNNSNGNIQASEFEICNSSGTKMPRPSGVSISTDHTQTSSSEDITKLIDGNTSTKYCATSSDGKCIITIDFGAGNYLDIKEYPKYKWYTANDVENRDPNSWTIEGSNDGTTWTVLSTVTNAGVTSSRNSLAGTWNIKTYPSTVYFNYGDWSNSTWTVTPSSNQGTVTKYTDRVTFYNSSADSNNYLSSDPIDGTRDFLFEVRANIPNTSASYHGVYLLDIGNSSIGFNTNRESSYRNQIWCQLWNTSSSQRYAGESNSGTRDYFIKKEGNVLTMGRDGATKYTNNNYTFASTYYVNEGVYRDTLTIYTAKLTYL